MIAYILCGGIEIVIKCREPGLWKEEIFRGTDEELHSPSKRNLHDKLEGMTVNFLGVEDGALLIGVD